MGTTSFIAILCGLPFASETIAENNEQSYTVSVKEVKLDDAAGSARLWRGTPKRGKGKTIFFINGTTIDDLENQVTYFASRGYVAYALSWRDIDPKFEKFDLPSRRNGPSLVDKATEIAKLVVKRIPEGEEILLFGASNGGIIASRIASETKNCSVVYFMSQGELPLAYNNHSELYAHDDLRDDTNIPTSGNIYAFLSTNDTFFPFSESYSKLYIASKGYISVSENINHSSRDVDILAVVANFFENKDKMGRLEKPDLNLTRSPNSINVFPIWQGVKDIKVTSAMGESVTFSFFFNQTSLLLRNFPSPVHILISGICEKTGLPVAYYEKRETLPEVTQP